MPMLPNDRHSPVQTDATLPTAMIRYILQFYVYYHTSGKANCYTNDDDLVVLDPAMVGPADSVCCLIHHKRALVQELALGPLAPL